MPIKNKNEYNEKHYRKNAKRLKANQKVRYMLKTGKIVMPLCQVCGSNQSKPWFNDYDKPETFDSYCTECKEKEIERMDAIISVVEKRIVEDEFHRDFGKSLNIRGSKQ